MKPISPPPLLMLFAALCGCSPEPRIIVRNLSPQALTNVVVSGVGFSQRVPVIEPGQRVQFRVKPSGESGLGLRFDAAQRTVDSGKQGYFEPQGRYRVEAVIHPDLNVSVTAKTSWF